VPIRAVTLDAAGTLFGLAEPVGVTYGRLAAGYGMRLDPTAVERRFRDALATARPLAFPGAAPSHRPALERAWWHRLVAAALDAPPGPAVDAAFDDLYAHYARGEAWRVFPEVPGALARLRGRGVRLAVVSNFDARLAPILESLGLAASFDAVVHSSAVGSAKPAPAIFHAALSALAVEPANALHVGDDPVADVQGALGAGLGAVLIVRGPRPSPAPAGVRVVDSLLPIADA
jgi:putative hydrolase of the HAD superfamily